MGRVKRPYGAWSQGMLGELREAGVLKVEAFLAWLAERSVQIDRTLLSHWEAGRSHLPADLLPCLAEFTGRPDLVFGRYLREVGCDVVRLPDGMLGDAGLTEAMLAAGAAVGRLQLAVLEARLPQSPGGTAITAGEREMLGRQVERLMQQLADLKAQIRR